MSFAPIQKEVDDYISQFKEGYFPPLSMLARMTEELGELARAEPSGRIQEAEERRAGRRGSR